GFQTVGKAAELAGKGMTQLAANDHLGAVTTAADAVADTLDEIPIVGKVYSAEIKAATAAVKAYAQTVKAFVQRGQELQGYSGALSGANAEGDGRGTLADVKEAQKLGQSLAKLTEQQSRAEIATRDFFLPIKEVLTKHLADLAESAADILEWLKPFGEDVA